MFSQLFALLFYSREYAHRAHLASRSHAQHVILDSFYKELLTLVDALVEAYQGYAGITGIPYLNAEDDLSNPAEVLKQHLILIESLRSSECAEYTPIQSIIDDVCGLYLSTLYKLRCLV